MSQFSKLGNQPIEKYTNSTDEAQTELINGPHLAHEPPFASSGLDYETHIHGLPLASLEDVVVCIVLLDSISVFTLCMLVFVFSSLIT